MRASLLVLALTLVPASTSAAAVGTPRFSLTAITNAHYQTHHLIGNGVTSSNALQANRRKIDANLEILDSLDLTQPIATQYRMSMVKIETGLQYFEQAKRSAGKLRSDLVEKGNQALRAAKALLDAAVKIFNEILPRLQALFKSGGKSDSDNNGHRPFPFESKFKDCVKGQSKPTCCTDNYFFGIYVLNEIKKWLTEDEYNQIKDCLDRVLARCQRLYEDHGIKFNKEYWEDCFEGYVKWT